MGIYLQYFCTIDFIFCSWICSSKDVIITLVRLFIKNNSNYCNYSDKVPLPVSLSRALSQSPSFPVGKVGEVGLDIIFARLQNDDCVASKPHIRPHLVLLLHCWQNQLDFTQDTQGSEEGTPKQRNHMDPFSMRHDVQTPSQFITFHRTIPKPTSWHTTSGIHCWHKVCGGRARYHRRWAGGMELKELPRCQRLVQLALFPGYSASVWYIEPASCSWVHMQPDSPSCTTKMINIVVVNTIGNNNNNENNYNSQDLRMFP